MRQPQQSTPLRPTFVPSPFPGEVFGMNETSTFICASFNHFSDGIPEPVSFCEKLARLHRRSSQAWPDAKFGFHCTTYNGDLPQDNTWSSSWEVFFANGLRHVLKVREERAGSDAELDRLTPDLFNKVIPRLLRPLETKGRTVKPALIHGDLWCGNVGIVDKDTLDGIVYDPASFWAHNECKNEPCPVFQTVHQPKMKVNTSGW